MEVQSVVEVVRWCGLMKRRRQSLWLCLLPQLYPSWPSTQLVSVVLVRTSLEYAERLQRVADVAGVKC